MTTIFSEPNIEAVSLAGARRQCGVDDDITAFDALLAEQIAAARAWAEARFGISICAHDAVLTLDATTDPFELPRAQTGAFRGLAARVEAVPEDGETPAVPGVYPVTATLADGSVVEIAATEYTLKTTGHVPVLQITTLPAHAVELTVRYLTGYLTERAQTQEVTPPEPPEDEEEAPALGAQVIILEGAPLHLVQAVYATVTSGETATIVELAADAYAVATVKQTSTVTVNTVPEGTTALEVVYATGVIPRQLRAGLNVLTALFYRERELTNAVGVDVKIPPAVYNLLGLGRTNTGVF